MLIGSHGGLDEVCIETNETFDIQTDANERVFSSDGLLVVVDVVYVIGLLVKYDTIVASKNLKDMV